MQEQITKIKQAYVAFIDNKLTSLSQKHKMGIFAASLLVPVILFFFLFYSPNNEKKAKLIKDNRYLKGEIQKVEIIELKLRQE